MTSVTVTCAPRPCPGPCLCPGPFHRHCHQGADSHDSCRGACRLSGSRREPLCSGRYRGGRRGGNGARAVSSTTAVPCHADMLTLARLLCHERECRPPEERPLSTSAHLEGDAGGSPSARPRTLPSLDCRERSDAT